MSVAQTQLRIPVIGYMVPNGRGGYRLDKKQSEWQSISPKRLADALITLNAGKVPGIEREVVRA